MEKLADLLINYFFGIKDLNYFRLHSVERELLPSKSGEKITQFLHSADNLATRSKIYFVDRATILATRWFSNILTSYCLVSYVKSREENALKLMFLSEGLRMLYMGMYKLKNHLGEKSRKRLVEGLRRDLDLKTMVEEGDEWKRPEDPDLHL